MQLDPLDRLFMNSANQIKMEVVDLPMASGLAIVFSGPPSPEVYAPIQRLVDSQKAHLKQERESVIFLDLSISTLKPSKTGCALKSIWESSGMEVEVNTNFAASLVAGESSDSGKLSPAAFFDKLRKLMTQIDESDFAQVEIRALVSSAAILVSKNKLEELTVLCSLGISMAKEK